MVVSVSPQSRASITANYQLTIEQVHALLSAWMLYSVKLSLIKQVASKLTAFFKAIGVEYVFDTTFSKDMALIER